MTVLHAALFYIVIIIVMYYVHFPFIVFFSFSGIWDMMPYYEDVMAKRLEKYENLSIREQKVRVSVCERERRL